MQGSPYVATKSQLALGTVGANGFARTFAPNLSIGIQIGRKQLNENVFAFLQST
jgi:hypothetical protein